MMFCLVTFGVSVTSGAKEFLVDRNSFLLLWFLLCLEGDDRFFLVPSSITLLVSRLKENEEEEGEGEEEKEKEEQTDKIREPLTEVRELFQRDPD